MMLCDTNIISELAKIRPNAGVWKWASSQREISLSVITLEELSYGLAWKPSPRIRSWLDRFLDEHCTILPISPAIANLAGEMRGRLQAQGMPRTQADILIAATAIVHDCPLITRNEKDFLACGVELINPFS